MLDRHGMMLRLDGARSPHWNVQQLLQHPQPLAQRQETEKRRIDSECSCQRTTHSLLTELESETPTPEAVAIGAMLTSVAADLAGDVVGLTIGTKMIYIRHSMRQ